MTDITNIPLNKLTAWEGNVRKTQNKAGIDELAASIKAHGLQQNLIVKTDGKNYAVVAGRRRLTALQMLLKAGDVKPTYEVPCHIAADDANLSELSLVENTVRENMHPADECEAFTKLVEEGTPVADIAGRFGKTERYIEQRLRLARGVSKKVMKAYRDGEMTLEQLQAFTVTDDFKAQEEVLKRTNFEYTDADEIRDELTQERISGKDRRVKYVTLEAYEKAGGKISRDLFGAEEDCYILDEALLDKLAAEKLAKSAATVEKEGWKWVEIHPTGMKDRHRLRTIYANKGKWTKEQMSYAGAIVCIGHDGKADIERGAVRPADMPKPKTSKSEKGNVNDTKNGDAEQQQTGISAALVEALTIERTEAIAIELAQRPDLALVAVVHAMAVDIILSTGGGTVVQVSANEQYFGEEAGGEARLQLAKHQQIWGESIPGDEDLLWKWCLEQDRDKLLDLLAFCAAKTVNVVRKKHDNLDDGRFALVDMLASEMKFDMRKWFTATADNYFIKVGKDQCVEAIEDVKGTLPSASAKKADVAKMAEQAVAGKGWLPKILR